MVTARAMLGSRARAAVLALVLGSIAMIPGAASGHAAIVDPALRSLDGIARVIVQALPGAAGNARDAVERVGGTVGRHLPIVDGFSASIPAHVLDDVARARWVRAITLDRPLRLMDASVPAETKSVYRDLIGTQQAWDAGTTGAGVTIAVIDTGIAPVADLAGRIVSVGGSSCVNFSGEAGCADGYGHGTFVAGIAAGSGASSSGRWAGVAPGAKVLSVKLAGANGAADVSTLLAALQWIVSFKDTYGIRVINLSLGTDSPQPYLIDPLNFAVERAWNAGIVVVVAASNRGPGPASITKPADDPWVITVGAIDDRGTLDRGDDLVPDFSARGPTLSDSYAKPDLVAPGAHMVSLRSPGSAIDAAFPTVIDGAYRRASGTSFATPAVAGVVALMLERNPQMTPNQVKYALMASADVTASSNPFAVGAGMVDAASAVLAPPAGSANQGLLQSEGTGSLHASRGTMLVRANDALGTLVQGVTTQQLRVFNQLEYRSTQWTGASWHGASWHGASWHGASWHGASWHGASWHEADGSRPTYGTGYLGSSLYGAWE